MSAFPTISSLKGEGASGQNYRGQKKLGKSGDGIGAEETWTEPLHKLLRKAQENPSFIGFINPTWAT